MKTPKYFLCALRREIALDIRYDKNQYSEKHHNLYHIIDEKAYASADFFACVKTKRVKKRANKPVQPRHTEYLILKKTPYCTESFHISFTFLYINLNMSIYNTVIKP